MSDEERQAQAVRLPLLVDCRSLACLEGFGEVVVALDGCVLDEGCLLRGRG